MRKPRVLCIPPYSGMYDLIVNIAAQRNDVELIIHMGNLDEGISALLENYTNDIDAIISRGGTAEVIHSHCGTVPVYDITPSPYDVLKSIRLAQEMRKDFVLMGFSSITVAAEMLKNILQYDFRIITITNADECEAYIRELKDEGVLTIVGDMISVTCAQKHGLHGLLILSGIESIETNIDKAIEMCRYHSGLRKHNQLFTRLLSSDTSSTVIFTSDRQEYFSTVPSLPDRVLRLLKSKVPDVITRKSVKFMSRLDHMTLSVKGRLLGLEDEDFCAYSLSYHASPAAFDGIRYLSADDDIPDCEPLEYYLGSTERTLSTLTVLDRYASQSSPVLLMGETGTGKDRFAFYIYSHSKSNHSSFVLVDTDALDDMAWNHLLTNDNSPLTDTGLTIYFRQINAAPVSRQRELLMYLKNTTCARVNRLIFSYTIPGPQGQLYLYLSETLHCLRFTAPSLSQRVEDIPALVSLYINIVNIKCGTRVAGFTSEAVLRLQNHRWPRNINQLFQLIQELVINSKTSYISDEEVKEKLAASPAKAPPFQNAKIDLNKTLSEITNDIVMHIYREENMNQSRTAKRLGISRSTLWRMLK